VSAFGGRELAPGFYFISLPDPRLLFLAWARPKQNGKKGFGERNRW